MSDNVFAVVTLSKCASDAGILARLAWGVRGEALELLVHRLGVLAILRRIACSNHNSEREGGDKRLREMHVVESDVTRRCFKKGIKEVCIATKRDTQTK